MGNNSFVRLHSFFVDPGWTLCNLCGRPEKDKIHIDLPPGFEPIETAPREAQNIQVLTQDNQILVAHFAQDLSGEEQPPFSGWFIENGDGYSQIETPRGWRSILTTK